MKKRRSMDDWIGRVFHPLDRILWMGIVRINRIIR